MNKKSDSKLVKKFTTTNKLVSSKNKFANENKNNSTNNFLNYKNEILNLQSNNLLDKLKLSDQYFDIMNNKWIIEKHIARYGICSEEAPENSLTAYTKAIELNYPILISVRVLKDETVVCFKDNTLTKLSSDGYLSNLTLDEIKTLKILKSNQTPPTIDEALELIKGTVPIILEVFNETTVGKLEENLLRSLENYSNEYNAYNKIAIMSMNPFTLNWFYNHAPWITRILKSCSFKSIKQYANIKTSKLKKLKLAKICHADFICYNAKDLPNNYIRKTHPVGLIAYNVTSQAQYEEMLTISDNVIFDGFIPQI